MSIDEPISPISTDDLDICINVLSRFNSNASYSLLESDEYRDLRSLIHNLFHVEKKLKKKRLQNQRLQLKLTDHKAKNSCLLRSGRAKKLQQLQLQHILVPDGTVQIQSSTPAIENSSSSNIPQRLLKSITCYICKLRYRTLHFFYDRLCPTCASFNFEKRLQTTDLSNRIALVTGGRVKIGYRIVLKLLRAKCFVIVTTRFPMDLLNRLKTEHDFEQWNDRVHIYGIDFRYTQLIEQFTKMLIEKYDRLDFLINNACQTIQKPKEFYQHLFHNERLINYSILSIDQQQILDGNLQFYKQFLPPTHQLIYQSNANEISLKTDHQIAFDVNQQPIDFRSTNSWTLRLGDLSTDEINEVLTINTLAPFILNNNLKVLMADKHPEPDTIKFIINVSAMEGSFSRKNKTDRHPHTNAAKAALNMMTRTSAKDYKKSNIYMVSVDTGWINDENPLEKAFQTMIQQDFQTPLDEEDAAARVLDPIINTYRQLAEGKTDIEIPYGCFLKDYRLCDW
jgi:NAD(P)-dependent dehydrogenase (short-subunit alcohol dehydrogenase family)